MFKCSIGTEFTRLKRVLKSVLRRWCSLKEMLSEGGLLVQPLDYFIVSFCIWWKYTNVFSPPFRWKWKVFRSVKQPWIYSNSRKSRISTTLVRSWEGESLKKDYKTHLSDHLTKIHTNYVNVQQKLNSHSAFQYSTFPPKYSLNQC